MSCFGRLFGKRSDAGPSAEEVIAHATAVITDSVPGSTVGRRTETALEITAGGRTMVWNLANPIRLAAGEADWKAGIAQLAQKVVAALATPATEQPSKPLTADTVVVLVWPQAKLKTFPFPVVTDPFVGGLAFFYGVRGGGTIASITPEALAASGLDRAALRQHAFENLGISTESLKLAPIRRGAPVLTNEVGSMVASSLLVDTDTWQDLVRKLGPLVVAVPAPSRIFVAPDRPEIVVAMRQVLELSLKMEEEVLSTRLLRFDGEQWSDEPLN